MKKSRQSSVGSYQQFAYAAILREGPDGFSTISRCDQYVPGHTPQPKFGGFATYLTAQRRANELNAKLGLSQKEAGRIVLSTMGFGRSA